MTTRDIAIRGKYTGLQTKPKGQQGPFGTGTLHPGVLTVSYPQTHKTGHPGEGAVTLVFQRVTGCMMPHYKRQGKEVKWREGPSLPVTTSSS